MGAPRGALCLAVLAVLAGACGSSGTTAALAAGDVAVVGHTHITKAQLRHQIAIEVRSMRVGAQSCVGGSQGQEKCKDVKDPVPQVGTRAYRSTVVYPVVTYLVQDAQMHAIARELGVVVTPDQIRSVVEGQIQQLYGGDAARYRADLARFHLTAADVEQQVEFTLIQHGIDRTLRRQVHVKPAAVLAYFRTHRQLYETDAATRAVDYVLEPSRAAAARARRLLAAGRSFAAVASGAIDSSALHQPFVATKGRLDASFQRAVFRLRTGRLSGLVPVSRPYARADLPGRCKPTCYYVLRPTAATMSGGTLEPFAAVEAQVHAQLLSALRSRHVQAVIARYERQQRALTRYAPGYRPPRVATPAAGVPTQGAGQSGSGG
jgi:parvulin-like peptidyl-prolyl cis-trans isomerase-like protein